MYARVTILHGRGDQVDAAQHFWEHEVLPALRLQPGFCRLLVVADRATGKSYALTLWASEEDEQASMRADYIRELIARADDLLVEPPVLESYEVIVSSSE
jgi:quinol monooxygenase YgiN